MESSNQDNYSLNSSIDQEVDQQEQEEDCYMGGVSRSYECVFCKGGFNTAQALGGHMNIHRKDKLVSRNKPSTTTHNLLSSTTNKHEIHNNLSLGPPRCTGANLRCYNVAEAQSTYFPTSTSTNDPQIYLNQNRNSSYSSHYDHHNIECLNLFGDDLGLQFGKGIEIMEKKGDQEDDLDLDLELRLGHHPLK